MKTDKDARKRCKIVQKPCIKMNKVLLKTLKHSLGVLGAVLLLTNAALATKAPSKKLANVTETTSVTSVSLQTAQASDLPSDVQVSQAQFDGVSTT